MGHLKSTTAAEKKVYGFIRDLCGRETAVQRVILFGSRARGDHQERSDFDDYARAFSELEKKLESLR